MEKKLPFSLTIVGNPVFVHPLLCKQSGADRNSTDLGNKSEAFKRIYRSIHPDPRSRAKVPILEVGVPGEHGYVKLVESAPIAKVFRSQLPLRLLVPMGK